MLKREPSKVTVARFLSRGSAAWSALKPRTNSPRSTSTFSGILGAEPTGQAEVLRKERTLARPVITLADSWIWGCGPFQRVEWPHPRRPTGRAFCPRGPLMSDGDELLKAIAEAGG